MCLYSVPDVFIFSAPPQNFSSFIEVKEAEQDDLVEGVPVLIAHLEEFDCLNHTLHQPAPVWAKVQGLCYHIPIDDPGFNLLPVSNIDDLITGLRIQFSYNIVDLVVYVDHGLAEPFLDLVEDV